MTLREQVISALSNHGHTPGMSLVDDLADAVLAVFAERERLLRERIEALRDQWHDCAPDDRPDTMTAMDDVLGVFDDES